MCPAKKRHQGRASLHFKSFHEIMTKRVAEILLVSSTYDAFIMQEDGPLAERIIHEYRGLNLSRPPRLTWISGGADALDEIAAGEYDLVIVMPHVGDMDAYELCEKIEQLKPSLPLYYFAYDAGQLLAEKDFVDRSIISRTLIWSGDTDLLLAVVKNQEDKLNVEIDTKLAGVRVIIFVEDSPLYLSSLLPVLYREIVLQTQAVMDDSLNEKDRLLRMRTRPKILVAENYDEAWQLYQKYKQYLFCVISDVRYEKDGLEQATAGIELLTRIHDEKPDIPLLILSSEEENRKHAEAIPALFSNKNSLRLHHELNKFFVHSLCFGDFLFRLEYGGEVIARAANLRAMSKKLKTVDANTIIYHAKRNEFSRWLMARFEMELAQQIRATALEDFASVEGARQYLITIIRNKLKKRQQGLVSDFDKSEFDPDSDFVKIGKGSLGGKARGLAFIANFLQKETDLIKQFEDIEIALPKTMVISTEGFDLFIEQSRIDDQLNGNENDKEIKEIFKDAPFPSQLQTDLQTFLAHTDYPLAVRSSAILEDAHYRASAGAYSTYMLPNDHPNPDVRLQQLIQAVKLVYSSVYQETPKVLAKNSVYRQEDDKMAVIVQQLVGGQYDNYFYPAISGVAQSYNYYPVSHMKPGDGVAHIALGLGKIVVDGGVALRFSPKYPKLLPQFSTVEDILKNSQRIFYALQMQSENGCPVEELVIKLDVSKARNHLPVRKLASVYNPEDNRIRDYYSGQDMPIMGFAPVLKYNEPPLGDILTSILTLGEEGMGCPVEIEFAVNLLEKTKPKFYLLQIRPMAVSHSRISVELTARDKTEAWCYSTLAMGQSQETPVSGIILVKPERFDTAKTREIAREVEAMNGKLKSLDKKYILIGPGRWGSSDRWLGIPLGWNAITEVQTIIETTSEKLHADPSQGSHFFHNITTLGINYLGIPPRGESFINLSWLDGHTTVLETDFLKYIELETPALLKIDGQHSRGAILFPGHENLN